MTFRKIVHCLFLLPLLFLTGTYSPPFSAAQEPAEIIDMAPVNPDFLYYLNNPEVRLLQQPSDEHGLGLIPSPLDFSHLNGLPVFEGPQVLGFPVTYDLRTQGKVTPVRNQGGCGSCWAFATFGSLESNLLPSEALDFSEDNLINTHGFDPTPCAGGNANMATAYLVRWDGPVSEADDPYNFISPPGLTTRKHVQEVLVISNRTGPLQNDNIKQAVMTYGALYTSMYWTDASYQSGNHAYYYSGGSSSNHAVAIIGWDDNYDKIKFPSAPSGNGAFIVRNSWGSGFGENGYFYVSYYDSIIGKGNYVFHGAESISNYNHIYQYDPLGWIGNIGLGNNTAWFANIFTAVSDASLTAVSFYTASLNSTYEIHIYNHVTSGPISGSHEGSATGTIAMPGYHTLLLDSPVLLTAGQNFSVIVNLTTPGYNFPIPYEGPISGYSSQAVANPGESYISSNGTSWTDLTSIAWCTECNVCLKAFTTSPTAFVDVPSGYWAHDFIEAIYEYGITGGCSTAPLKYCPDNSISRAQMAVFIEASLGVASAPPCTGTVFNDVNALTVGSSFCGYIEDFAARGITGGCGGGNYCPNVSVNRAQMAVFIEAALGATPAPSCTGMFHDVDAATVGDFVCRYIENFSASGITGGCGGGNYCPFSPVTRAQMAVFLVAAPAPLNP